MRKFLTAILISISMLLPVFTFTACPALDRPIEAGYYRVTVEDPENFLRETLYSYYEEGEEVVVKTHIIHDADLICYLDGASLGTQTAVKTDGKYTHWEYYFTMPAHDVTLTFEVSAGAPIVDPVIETVRARTLMPWIADLQAEDILSIEREREYIGVSPDTFTSVKITTAQADKERAVNYLKNLTFTICDDPQIAGGAAVSLTIRTQSETYSIRLSNGYYYMNGVCYSPLTVGFPDFETDKTYRGFASWGNNVLYIDGALVEECGDLIGGIVFEETEDSLDTYYIDYVLKTDFIELKLHDEKYFFYDDGDGFKTYKLVGEVDFSEIFALYPIFENVELCENCQATSAFEYREEYGAKLCDDCYIYFLESEMQSCCFCGSYVCRGCQE